MLQSTYWETFQDKPQLCFPVEDDICDRLEKCGDTAKGTGNTRFDPVVEKE